MLSCFFSVLGSLLISSYVPRTLPSSFSVLGSLPSS